MAMMDSKVVQALHEGQNLERLLEALGCDTRKDNGSEFESPAGFIHCPMPDHPDANPSATVRVDQGQVFCHSRCDSILPMDLVIAHGHASTRGDAAKFIERTLGITPDAAPKRRPVVDDPSLTVAQYLAMKGISQATADLFHLEDVLIWQAGADRGTRDAAYETGWYSAVFMPLRDGYRPRVRSDAPGVKVKWCPKARYLDRRFEDWTADTSQGISREWPLDVIGFDQLQPTDAGQPNVLIPVEGESDVHAMHEMGLPCVIGVPGSKLPKRLARALLESCVKANEGDTDLSTLAVLVWQEPGSAGVKFPADVAAAISDAALQQGWNAPRFGVLHHGNVESQPKDPCALLLDRTPAIARKQVEAAIHDALAQTGVAAAIASSAVAVNRAIQAPLEVLQVDGLHTPPPATSAAPGDPTTIVELGAGWSAETNSAPLKVLPGSIPAYMVGDVAVRPGSAGPIWSAFDDLEDNPARDLAPERVDGVANGFIRSAEGWSMEKVSSDGDLTLVPICTPFVVERVERCSGEILVRVAAPFGGAWNRTRLPMGTTADAGRTCAQLATVGVATANRQRPAVTDLLLALTMAVESTTGAVSVPAGTGWSGRPGSSPFGGIEVEPVNDFGARMFEANERRRSMHEDTMQAAQAWWKVADELLTPPPGEPAASHAAPLLAIGAAAAAPLVGPLSEVGVNVAPVVWIAGLGGGGKSITQRLAASIYAPELPDLDGQIAFFANANISQAALSARVDSCRDLPLILDDVTQLPPLPGSTSRGDAARIEAAAALGMLVFNRKPIERATRDGGIRQTRAFRSTALLSAEISMSSESSKAVVTAGHRRRISTIEARPMTERNLGQGYAERVNRVAGTVGGAPGELHVNGIREAVAARELRDRFDAVRRRIAAMPEAAGVTNTQVESLAANLLGIEMLADSSSEHDVELFMNRMMTLLGPYMEAGAGAGGATRDSDLSGVDAAMRSVDDLRAAHPTRFDNQIRDEAGLVMQPPTAGYLGKELRPLYDGSRQIALLRPGMEMLQTRYGVSMQVVEQAISEKRCERKQVRFDQTRIYCMVWTIPPSDPEDPFVDPTLPPGHEPDPHGLAAPVEPLVRIPGASSTATVDTLAPPQAVNAFVNEADATCRQPQEEDLMRLIATNPFVDNELNLNVPSPESMHEPVAQGRGASWGYDHEHTLRTTLELRYRHELTRLLYPHPNLTETQRMDARFSFGNGLYMVGDGPSMRNNQSIMVTIRREARQELEALQMQYRHAAEANPDYVIGVADFPADDDPRWAHIDALGLEVARSQWQIQNEALYQRNVTSHKHGIEAARAYDEAYVKATRVALMCRYRQPSWFIQGRDVA